MAQITHTPFLQNRANLLVIPVSSDGTIFNRTLLQLMTLYPCCRDKYKSLAIRGELNLGDVILHKISKQTIGLGAGSNATHDYIALLITTNHPSHTEQISTITTALKSLQPKLYHLMRYEGLRRVAVLAQMWQTDTLSHQESNEDNAQEILQLIDSTLDTCRVKIDVHL